MLPISLDSPAWHLALKEKHLSNRQYWRKEEKLILLWSLRKRGIRELCDGTELL
jgi:hypothetical protein